MSRVCFGQNFEDVVLWRALNGVAKGRYLDIGAQHPEIDSVSLSFYREGWRGVHVEPTTQYSDLLRKARPDETVIQAAAGDGDGLLKMHVFPDTGLSTSIASVSEAHRLSGLEAQKIDVPIVSLQTLLDGFAGDELHWLKIDVEGMEAAVLRSWGASKVRPWIVLVEAIDPTTGEHTDQQWRKYLEDRHYHEVLFDGVSRFFVADEHADLDAAFTTQANCLDQFYVPWHHWSAANVVHQFRDKIAREQQAQSLAEADRDAKAVQIDALQAENDQLSEAVRERDHQLQLHASENAQLGEAIKGRDGQLRLNAAELQRLEIRHRELADLSRTLAEQVEAANSRAADREKERNALLQSALAQIEGLRLEIAGHLAARTQDHGRLQRAEQIVALCRQKPVSFAARLLATVSSADRRRRNLLGHAVAAWTSHSLNSSPGPQVLPTIEVNTMDIFAFEHRNPYLRADSLEELCSFADADFIRCAYVTILGRQPDPDGERRYVMRLRQGASKIGIIADLRISGEGKRHDPGIAGLDRTLRMHRNANRPVIGWIVRTFTGREGNSPVERQVRALSNMFELERVKAAARASTANHLQHVLDEKVDALNKELRVALAGRSASACQINQAEAAGDTEWEATLHSVLNG